MIALDTNVLVRYIVQDDNKQAQRATALIERAAEAGERLFIAHVVLCELSWVLDRAYARSRDEVSVVVEAVLKTAQFDVEDVALAHRALFRFQGERGDFADYIVAERARGAGCEGVATFDKRLLREAGFVAP